MFYVHFLKLYFNKPLKCYDSASLWTYRDFTITFLSAFGPSFSNVMHEEEMDTIKGDNDCAPD